jgi:hypothetical protein
MTHIDQNISPLSLGRGAGGEALQSKGTKLMFTNSLKPLIIILKIKESNYFCFSREKV